MVWKRWTILLHILLRVLSTVRGAERELPTELDDPIIGSQKGAIHIWTSTECYKSYFVYQMLTLKYSMEKVGQPGSLTRVVSCNEDKLHDKMSQEDLDMMDTLVVPNWTQHPKTGDYYQPYNRPVALIFWLAERKPTAEWTLIIDPDMIFNQPFYPETFNLSEGFAASSHYNYLIGGNNELATRHIGKVPPKDDQYGGQRGRRADESGAFMFMRTRDLIKVAPLWLKYTEDVRQDPNAWNLTGDNELKQGEKAWISEMYGYIFAAAAAGIRHKVEVAVQYYPEYEVRDIPVLFHYGLEHHLNSFVWDKHHHFDFESFKCPPWNMRTDRPEEDDYGLFPHPPLPHEVKATPPRVRYAQLAVILFMNMINKALCLRHREKCPDSDDLRRECDLVDKIEKKLEKEIEPLYLPGILCHDDVDNCITWRINGECENSWMYMTEHCRASCEKCRKYISPAKAKEKIEGYAAMDHEPQMERLLSKEVINMSKRKCKKMNKVDFYQDPICRLLESSGVMQPTELYPQESGDVVASTFSFQNAAHENIFIHNGLVWAIMLTAAICLIVYVTRKTKYKTHLSKHRL